MSFSPKKQKKKKNFHQNSLLVKKECVKSLLVKKRETNMKEKSMLI